MIESIPSSERYPSLFNARSQRTVRARGGDSESACAVPCGGHGQEQAQVFPRRQAHHSVGLDDDVWVPRAHWIDRPDRPVRTGRDQTSGTRRPSSPQYTPPAPMEFQPPWCWCWCWTRESPCVNPPTRPKCTYRTGSRIPLSRATSVRFPQLLTVAGPAGFGDSA